MVITRAWWIGLFSLFLIVGSGIGLWFSNHDEKTGPSTPTGEKSFSVEDEWRGKLSPEAYAILREGGTERPYSSPLNDEKRPGTYYAADTGKPVFRSEDKFDSGTGWPSFTQPISSDVIETEIDHTLGFERTEVLTTAGGHLGHVFTDGPAPTGLRYCINGAALTFIPDEK